MVNFEFLIGYSIWLCLLLIELLLLFVYWFVKLAAQFGLSVA